MSPAKPDDDIRTVRELFLQDIEETCESELTAEAKSSAVGSNADILIGGDLGRRLAHIDVDIDIEESERGMYLDKWRRATEILLNAMERKAKSDRKHAGSDFAESNWGVAA